jgi:general secretion pathway protein G
MAAEVGQTHSVLGWIEGPLAQYADLRGIENALKFYRLDNFAYPTSEQGLEALVTRPADPNIRNWKPGGYLDRLPKDPWGNNYQYLNPGQNSEIDIYTFGRDGRPGGEGIDADIGNWNLE